MDLTGWISAGLVIALLSPTAAMAGDDKSNTQQPQTSQASSPTPDAASNSAATTDSRTNQTSNAQLPDSPGAVRSETTANSQANDQVPEPPPAAQSTLQPPPQAKPQQPAGTAAAQVESTTGDAAFTPAGAAIAPAKQKRTRMFLIKIGALVGAGVALGSVAALSSASPSRPPGSH